jgi:hypothetical protein
MTKFKRIFYLAYVLYFCFGGFIAYNYEDLVLRWDWDFINTWAGLLRFVLKLSAFGLILFVTEIVIENIQIFSLRNKIKSLENDVIDLKGKLYDKSVIENEDEPTIEDKEEYHQE